VTDFATACRDFKDAKIAALLNPDDTSLRDPLKHTRWRLQKLSIVDYLRMVEQAHAEASAIRGITDQCSPPQHEHRDAGADDTTQQQHDGEAKPGIDAVAVEPSAAAGAAIVTAEHPSTQRKKSASAPDRGHSARRPKPRRGP
jgi:hypothetical protein